MSQIQVFDDAFRYRAEMSEREWLSFKALVKAYEAQPLRTSLNTVERALIRIYLFERPDIDPLWGDKFIEPTVTDPSVSREAFLESLRQEILPNLSGDPSWDDFLSAAAGLRAGHGLDVEQDGWMQWLSYFNRELMAFEERYGEDE